MSLTREAHDNLLNEYRDKMDVAEYSEVIESHAENCPFCNDDITQDNPEEGGDMETFTKEQLDNAVNAAVASLQADLDSTKAELAGLKGDIAADEVDARVAEAQAESDARISELAEQLDAATLEASTAKADLEALETFLRDEAEKLELVAIFNARKEARLTEIAEKLPHMPEDRIAERIDAWTEKSDDEWASFLEDMSVTTTVKSDDEATSDTATLASTALNNTRKDDAPVTAKSMVATIAANRHSIVR